MQWKDMRLSLSGRVEKFKKKRDREEMLERTRVVNYISFCQEWVVPPEEDETVRQHQPLISSYAMTTPGKGRLNRYYIESNDPSLWNESDDFVTSHHRLHLTLRKLHRHGGVTN